jgi:hypothetical protein
MVATNWTIITPSRYEWERRALDFIRARFPTHDPYRAWANFEFQAADGAIYEVDLLVLTKQGFWLVEIKSRPGRVEGDPGTWIWTHNGRRFSDDNPVLLANRKAKALAALLAQQPACRKGQLPWLDALVFLSDPDIQCDLRGPARHRVCLTDREANHPLGPRQGIRAALINREVPGVEASPRVPIDIRVARMLTQALEQAGIRPSQQARRVGDYVLGELLADGPGYQDWLAEHTTLAGVHCRVRQYLVAQAASEEDRQRIQRVAAHEFRLLQGLEHPGILAVRDYKQHAYGPALLFHYEAQAVRFDHFLTTRGDRLTPDLRLNLLRQLADAMRYAHSKRIIHRALSPQSILVLAVDTETPSLKIFNWQVGVRSTGAAASGTTHVQELVETQALVYMAPEALLSPDQITEAADVFSLGAIAYHLFSGRVPAANTLALAQALRTQKGLKLSAVIDGVGPCLEGLVQWSTHPDVLTRVGSVADFLELLEDVEEELTAPEGQTHVDPVHAKRGDRLEHGFVVERILGQQYHVVVGNPPYITVKDAELNAAYRERYDTCHRQYSLVVPFIERFFDLAQAPQNGHSAGYVGMITANSFMKREFGKKLIEEFLPRVDLTHVIDTSGAYIPGHGTPTVILFGRNRNPMGDEVRAVLGIRGEPGTPVDPAQGLVWQSLVDHLGQNGSQNEFVTVPNISRETFAKHPWSLGGGGQFALTEIIEQNSIWHLQDKIEAISLLCITREDEAYLMPQQVLNRMHIRKEHQIVSVQGEQVRDWQLNMPGWALFPYDVNLYPVSFAEGPEVHRFLWPIRELLWRRRELGGDHRELGRTWWEWNRFLTHRFRQPLSIAFAFVTTHNNFVLDRGGKVFNRTAPVIKLPRSATEDDYLALLGLLNSSTACFWMKQILQDKGNGGIGGGIGDELWERRYEHSAAGLSKFPVPEGNG